MRRSGLIAAALLAVPAAVSAQQTLLRLAPPEGQVSRYRIETTTAIDMMGGSVSANSIMVMTATVTAAAGEERTVRTVIDSFRVDAPGMPMPPMPDLVGSSTTVRMNTRGQVLETTYSNDALTEAFGGMAGPAGQSFQAGMTLPEAPVDAGYQWSDSNTVQTDGGQMGDVTVTTRANYTLERIFRRAGARIAVVAIQGTITQDAGMMTAEGTMTGAMEFDLDAGRWVQNRITVELTMQAGAQDAMMTITTNGRLVS